MKEWGTDWSHDVLTRIVALLFSLAVLAERAAALPGHRRRHLLGILGRAEAVAHAFLIGGGAPVSAGGQETADDALRLAARLRALALLLVVLMSQPAQMVESRCGRAQKRALAAPAPRPASPPAHDTS